LGGARKIIFAVLERVIIVLSYTISFVLDSAGTKKLLRVELDNLGYFWVLIAQVTFIHLLLSYVALGFMFSYVLDFLLPVLSF